MPEQYKTTSSKACIQLILTYNANTGNPTKSSESKSEPMNMKLLKEVFGEKQKK
jgi:hypothetical protein